MIKHQKCIFISKAKPTMVRTKPTILCKGGSEI